MRVLFTFCFVILIACNQQEKHKVIQNDLLSMGVENDLKQWLKEDIFFKCKKYDSSHHIYDITLSRLNKSTIINLRPVIYYDYLKDKGAPLFFYEFNDILFLIYSGLEEMLTEEKKTTLLKNKYDSTCLLYNIKDINSTYDKEPLFLKLTHDTLTTFYDSKFHMLFYDKQIDTTAFTPFN